MILILIFSWPFSLLLRVVPPVMLVGLWDNGTMLSVVPVRAVAGQQRQIHLSTFYRYLILKPSKDSLNVTSRIVQNQLYNTYIKADRKSAPREQEAEGQRFLRKHEEICAFLSFLGGVWGGGLSSCRLSATLTPLLTPQMRGDTERVILMNTNVPGTSMSLCRP